MFVVGGDAVSLSMFIRGVRGFMANKIVAEKQFLSNTRVLSFTASFPAGLGYEPDPIHVIGEMGSFISSSFAYISHKPNRSKDIGRIS
jgi:hypothetical protein